MNAADYGRLLADALAAGAPLADALEYADALAAPPPPWCEVAP